VTRRSSLKLPIHCGLLLWPAHVGGAAEGTGQRHASAWGVFVKCRSWFNFQMGPAVL
jgi:hypothetical protein